MLIWIGVLVLVLVEGYKENICPRRDPPPGVLVLSQGSQVLLHCHGDVIVDRVLKVKGQTERPVLGADQQNEGTTSGDTDRTPAAESSTVTYHTETVRAFELDIKKNGYSTTERPQMMANTAMEVSHPPILTDDVTEEGGTVNLKRQSYWTLNNVPVQGSAEKSVLTLPHLGLKDLGNYSCYSQGVLLSSVKITFGTPPEGPILSCYKRSPESKIRCDWTSPQPVIPTPKCHILLQKSKQVSLVMCKYSVLHSRCQCVLNHEEDGDWSSRSRPMFTARLCVTNTAGNATSPVIRFTAADLIKPDPPASVRASGVEGRERILNVSWTYPTSWRTLGGIYLLQFQLRYRSSLSEMYQTVETQTLSWTIIDALPHTQYELQVRAIKEFGIGQWSTWSTPVYAYTWTILESTTTSQPDDILETLWIVEDSGSSEIAIAAAVLGTVFGVCVLVVMAILMSVNVFRHRLHFESTLGKLESSPASGGRHC